MWCLDVPILTSKAINSCISYTEVLFDAINTNSTNSWRFGAFELHIFTFDTIAKIAVNTVPTALVQVACLR
jgi:hypothetical protein